MDHEQLQLLLKEKYLILNISFKEFIYLVVFEDHVMDLQVKVI